LTCGQQVYVNATAITHADKEQIFNNSKQCIVYYNKIHCPHINATKNNVKKYTTRRHLAMMFKRSNIQVKSILPCSCQLFFKNFLRSFQIRFVDVEQFKLPETEQSNVKRYYDIIPFLLLAAGKIHNTKSNEVITDSLSLPKLNWRRQNVVHMSKKWRKLRIYDIIIVIVTELL